MKILMAIARFTLLEARRTRVLWLAAGLLLLGFMVTASAAFALAVRFSTAQQSAERLAYADAIAARDASGRSIAGEPALL